MQKFKAIIPFILITLLFPTFALAGNSQTEKYMEVTGENGKPLILKRDYTAEENIDREATAKACIYFNDSMSGYNLAPQTYVVAYTYTTTCASGYHTADSVYKYPYNAFIEVRLQKLIGGVWELVAGSSSGYSYNGTAGQYRIIVFNRGDTTTATSWDFDYSIPL